MIYHLEALNLIPHLFAQKSKAFKSSWSCIWSCIVLIDAYNKQSSAKSLTLDSMQFERSFIGHKKSRGSRTVPWHAAAYNFDKN